jgi:hypothetical protein
MVRRSALCAVVIAVLSGLSTSAASGAVGDVVAQITPQIGDPGFYFCSIGVAFDGTSLYVDKCGDPNIFEISTADGSVVSSFNPGIAEGPNALAFDAKRNGLWIGAQSCSFTGMPIHFWDFDDDSVTLMFTIPFALVNPATGASFLGFCFDDGLAYNENDPNSGADDEIWFSDDVNGNLGLFRPDGTLVAGFNAFTVDPSLQLLSGLAVGGSNLYMANNGGGDVFRADITAGLALVDQFTSGDSRQEDMECDPITFAPTEVMWVRTTPQGGFFPNVVTAFEIEPETCGLGGEPPGPTTCEPRTQGFWHRLCTGPHPEKPEDFDDIVAEVSGQLAAQGLPSDVCENLALGTGNQTPCQKAMAQYSALLLNIESGKLSPRCAILGCGGSVDGAVQDALDAIDGLIPPLGKEACQEAQSIAAEVNEGICLDPPVTEAASCGLGFEIALLLPAIMACRRLTRRTREAGCEPR